MSLTVREIRAQIESVRYASEHWLTHDQIDMLAEFVAKLLGEETTPLKVDLERWKHSEREALKVIANLYGRLSEGWQAIAGLTQTEKNEDILVGWEDDQQIMNVADAITARDQYAGPPLWWRPLPVLPAQKARTFVKLLKQWTEDRVVEWRQPIGTIYEVDLGSVMMAVISPDPTPRLFVLGRRVDDDAWASIPAELVGIRRDGDYVVIEPQALTRDPQREREG